MGKLNRVGIKQYVTSLFGYEGSLLINFPLSTNR